MIGVTITNACLLEVDQAFCLICVEIPYFIQQIVNLQKFFCF